MVRAFHTQLNRKIYINLLKTAKDRSHFKPLKAIFRISLNDRNPVFKTVLLSPLSAHDLAGSDQGGFNDPYVRLTLLPEIDTRKRQTTIHRNDPNPLFDQHFKFPISHDELQSKSLLLQVFDYDR